ncbi:hypothetical protein LOH54_09810 [Sulfurimonas sp. HSL-3221]|uniref:hypothetical protein n=1 Tax=Sulfurimonadaceae TaxID=2771471 RepID=UPI001E4BA762|nr:hypothetical protein [Sulfurimonas sp. HSL-3221]UFS61945.1 hypothetical protein LOH54_09810 [Sulfurimonas sp. HSL-3221]
MKRYLGSFTIDIYDLGGIMDTRINDEARWIVEQYIRTINAVADVDRMSLEQKVSGEYIDEELDRYRNLQFSFVMSSGEERHALLRELFRHLRDIDTGCMANVELEPYFGV